MKYQLIFDYVRLEIEAKDRDEVRKIYYKYYKPYIKASRFRIMVEDEDGSKFDFPEEL